ncbi:MAG: gamma-glutamyltranspeptidase [Planctomycetaceae bacterium]|nr:MAG: gamma-glutamyltranspeptidase [Planctomycetaceae bacterium]
MNRRYGLIVWVWWMVWPAVWGYDRPTGANFQSRSVVMARHGMVATSHPWAAQVGLDVLRRGGHAVDAAIAVNAMLGVVEPMSCGIGGDLFAIVYDARSQQVYGLNASGRSPRRLTREEVRRRGYAEIPETGPLSWSVPGCVDGWQQLLTRFGSRSLKELLAPAIATAEEGFPVSEIIASHWQQAEDDLRAWPDSARVFLPGGRAPRAGDVVRLPELAASYRLIAEHGPDVFYRGELARQIVEFSQQHGGYFDLEDFAQHHADWVLPLSINYRGYDVWELPPNTQGLAALQMLNILEGYDLRGWGPFSPDYLHVWIEAKKLAFADRARYYADPAFATLPLDFLLSKEYAAERRKKIDWQQAAVEVEPGRLPRPADTVYLTVVDAERNCCSLIQSIYYSFGSQVVPGRVGFALQNRGTLFAMDDEHPNRLEPGKRPFHTIIPALVTRDRRPVFCFGVMGGDMQAQGHVQVLVNLIDFGMNPQAAGDAPRIRHDGSASPTGSPSAAGGGTVWVESGMPPHVLEALARRGHRVQVGRSGFGGYQGIWIDWEHGVLHGASDPRKDGCAVGY